MVRFKVGAVATAPFAHGMRWDPVYSIDELPVGNAAERLSIIHDGLALFFYWLSSSGVLDLINETLIMLTRLLGWSRSRTDGWNG
ncbi:hypothetical protein ABDF71_26955 [Ochrobactrum sp. WV_118_8]|uniref:hypothetical protein n=1 Tax=Brucella anthropi TaxID=529 RepID=UPI00188CB184|nr:hypothetical protein [Brucella anthropi]QPA29849.1 hypothetical protein IR196_22825 [Brucella anthropi]